MPKPSSPESELMQLPSLVFLVRAIEAAVAVGLPEAIPVAAEDALTVAAIAKSTRLHAPYLYRLLRALSANGYFVEHNEQRFSHSDKSVQLRSDHLGSQRAAFLLNAHSATQRAWEALPAALRDGKAPFEHAHGVPLFAYLGQHSDMADIFNHAMVTHTRPIVQSLLSRDAQLLQSHSVCDVGGGLGQLLVALLKASTNLRGAVFDLSTLQGPALDYLATHGLQERAEFVPGNFLESIPGGYGTYIIKNCLWNWGDADTVQILRNVHTALGEEGRLLIVETLVSPDMLPQSTLMDLMMLVMPNGRARTQDEYVDLAAKAKLRLTRSSPVATGHSLLELRRS